MPYLKRQGIEKFWSIPRKGTKYLTHVSHNQGHSIPLVVVLRDILKLVGTKKQLKKIINEKQVKINQKEVREINYPIGLFDVISLFAIKKNYRVTLSKEKKMIFEEVSDKEAKTKIFKILDKKLLPNKKIQLNLMHGKNILTKEKVNVGDSLLINLEDNKVEKIIVMEKGADAFVNKGKHAGRTGKITEIMERGGKTLAKITTDTERINVWTKNIIAM